VGTQQANDADCRCQPQYTPTCLESSDCSRSSRWMQKKINFEAFSCRNYNFKNSTPQWLHLLLLWAPALNCSLLVMGRGSWCWPAFSENNKQPLYRPTCQTSEPTKSRRIALREWKRTLCRRRRWSRQKAVGLLISWSYDCYDRSIGRPTGRQVGLHIAS